MVQPHRWWFFPCSKVLGYKSMTDGGAVEVSLWEDGESPLPSFLHEGKLFLTFLLNVNRKEGISKIYPHNGMFLLPG